MSDELRDSYKLLDGKRVLVTGATGFIGGRLAERLAVETGALVSATGRNLTAVPFLAEVGADLRPADLLDLAAMSQLMAGQDIVFHVAAWLNIRHGTAEMAWLVNVFAVQQLIRLAIKAGVERFVLVSSVAAYGPPSRPVITEAMAVDSTQRSLYGRTKAEGERLALALGRESGLSVTVIRPGMVYGPRAQGWSGRMIRLIQRRVPVIFGDGAANTCPIYIDNLVDGLLLAAIRPEAVGEAFQMVDPPVSWREWFERYGQMCAIRPVRLPLAAARLALTLAERLPLNLSIDRGLLTYYTANAHYPTTKARQLLGYRPAVSFEEGMRNTEAWLRMAGYF